MESHLCQKSRGHHAVHNADSPGGNKISFYFFSSKTALLSALLMWSTSLKSLRTILITLSRSLLSPINHSYFVEENLVFLKNGTGLDVTSK